MRRRVPGINRKGLAEEFGGARVFGLRIGEVSGARLLIEVISGDARGVVERELARFVGGRFQAQGAEGLPGDPILQGKDVSPLVIEVLAPDRPSVGGANQVGA